MHAGNDCVPLEGVICKRDIKEKIADASSSAPDIRFSMVQGTQVLFGMGNELFGTCRWNGLGVRARSGATIQLR